MKNMYLFSFSAAAALLTLCGAPAAAEESRTPVAPPTAAAETLPDAAALQRLAKKAIWETTGIRMHVGPVILREKLADGSWLVDVTLESGRMVKGRLYRNRRRYHIAIDRRDLYSPEIKIVK